MGSLLCFICVWASLSFSSVSAGPLKPTEALKSFLLADDRLTIEVAASEPQIEDPVAVAWDEDGRMFVVEMRGFQQGPDYKGLPGLGCVSMFEDRDCDGVYEHHTIYADNMWYPTTVMPAYGGILVGCAPDILFFKDTDGDGKADVRKIVYTGFGRENHEQLINSFQWGYDNWIHAGSCLNGGQIRPGNQPDAKPIDVGTRNFRFRITSEGDPAGFETESGGGQFGLAADDAGRWFTSANPRHLIQIVMPEEYLRRNPYLAVPKIAVDIPDHGAACKVYRKSPLEEWRVVRTRQRAADPAYVRRLPPSELVPGGYITSGCGNSIYRADLLPPDYYGQSFTCEPANNLIHRDRLTGDGPQLTAVRIDQDSDFLVSTDNWFRPVNTSTGPDGCLYVVDMYRQVIETPVSIPPEILKTMNMDNGKDMGRVYRLRPKNAKPKKVPHLGKASRAELIDHLGDKNAWVRFTAQRLLFERNNLPTTLDPLEKAVREGNSFKRMHSLCALAALKWLSVDDIDIALRDEQPAVRRIALQLAEPLLSSAGAESDHGGARDQFLEHVTGLARDPSPLLRFQLALSLGSSQDPRVLPTLIEIARRDLSDPWIRTAILIAIGNRVADFWTGLFNARLLDKKAPGNNALVHELAAIVGSDRSAMEWFVLLSSAMHLPPEGRSWLIQPVLEGLRTGLERSGGHSRLKGEEGHDLGTRGILLTLMKQKGAVRAAAWELAGSLGGWPPNPGYDAALDQALTVAADSQAALGDRRAGLEFVAEGPAKRVAPRMLDLLTPEQPIEIQKAVVLALTRSGRTEVASTLLDRDRWFSYTPAVRDTLVTAMLARREYVPALLAAIKEGYVPAWIIDANQKKRLLDSEDPKISEAAAEVLKPVSGGEREKIYERYQSALNLKGDINRGREVFRTNCASCHKLESFGSAVGPDLAGVVDHPADQLLGDILIPSKAVTAGYSAYLVETQDGESLLGIIVSESPTAITLREKEGVEKTILRSQIKGITASTLSMMPENMEQTITPQQMTDLLAYIKAPK